MSIIKGPNSVSPVIPVATPKSTKSVSEQGGKDRVSTSAKESVERQVAESRSNVDATREERLEQLREQVRNGQFSVDVNKLADQILREADLASQIHSLSSEE